MSQQLRQVVSHDSVHVDSQFVARATPITNSGQVQYAISTLRKFCPITKVVMSDGVSPRIQFLHLFVSNLVTSTQSIQSRPQRNAESAKIVADVARAGIPPVKIPAEQKVCSNDSTDRRVGDCRDIEDAHSEWKFEQYP